MPGYWHAHSDRDWYAACGMHDEPSDDDRCAVSVTERRELLRRAEALRALRRAEVRLMQALDCPRIGYIADSFTQDAADLLDLAGLTELADRLRDDDFGGDVRAVADEVTKLREVTP